jgi:putative serine protease PepD
MSDDDLFWFPASGPAPDDPRPEAQRADSTQRLPGQSFDFPPPAPPYVSLSGNPAAAAPSRSRRGTAALLAATAFAFGGGGVAIGAVAVDHNNGSSVAGTGLTIGSASPASLTSNPRSYAAIAAKVLPSVVSINVNAPNESDTGSGVILRTDGYILTNNHVVSAASGGNGNVNVTFNDGTSAPAKIVGTDPLDDLAVLKVAKTGLHAATLGHSSQIQVGDPVLAVGSPLGLTGTVTAGIVSAVNRPVETQDASPQQQFDPFGFGNGNSSPQAVQPTVIDAIQTDAAINPGNSGGALVDAAGQVIGINSAIASVGSSGFGSQSGNIGVGFAIPIDQAKKIATELIEDGHATHPLLGVQLADATSPNGTARALVRSVTDNGPADKAGIKGGDVITAIDGRPTAGADAVIAAIRSFQPGDVVKVTYTRAGQSHTTTVTLTSASSS